MKVKFSPSLMCMDLLNIEREIKTMNPKSDYYHVDIIDYHYCRNMSLAPCFMEQIKKITDVPMDAHLYVDNIDRELVQTCMDSGAEIITMPPDVIERQAIILMRQIKAAGKKVGIFINPAVRLEVIEPYADMVDRLLIMTVDAGFAGQKFVPQSLDKIRQAKAWKRERGYTYEIAVDGCCNEAYYRQLYDAGTEVFIVGTSGLFSKDKDTAKALEITENLINEALAVTIR
ncbi:MAG: D-allulose 6-phosphate 3-epimerase [Lachnospiraceae bacterium]|nr:D-allulose 6-phosphate 3-epimerase [Lachnospiraceae bacterium]